MALVVVALFCGGSRASSSGRCPEPKELFLDTGGETVLFHLWW
jgi:hypothetical protein